MSSFGAAVYSAVAQGEAAKDATRAQERQAAAQNALLEKLYGESRGSTGHAILPVYLGDTEKALGTRAADTSRAVMDYYGSPADVAARGAAIANTYKPLLAQGTKSIYGIYSGEEEAKRMAAAAPAMAARTAAAGTTRAGINQSLLQRLNELNAQDASKGFVGTGSGAQQRLLGTRIAGNTAASQAEAAAALQNAQEQEAIRNQILDLQLRSPELATSLAGSASQLELLPGQLAGGINAAALSPLDYFRIGVGQPSRPEMAPWATPQVGLSGILANQAAQGESALLNWYLKKRAAEQYGPERGAGGYSSYGSQYPVSTDVTTRGGGYGGGGGYQGSFEGDIGGGSVDYGGYV